MRIRTSGISFGLNTQMETDAVESSLDRLIIRLQTPETRLRRHLRGLPAEIRQGLIDVRHALAEHIVGPKPSR